MTNTNLKKDIQAFVNANNCLPLTTDDINLYKRVRKFVIKINNAYGTKKTREEIVFDYFGIKLSNVSNIIINNDITSDFIMVPIPLTKFVYICIQLTTSQLWAMGRTLQTWQQQYLRRRHKGQIYGYIM